MTNTSFDVAINDDNLFENEEIFYLFISAVVPLYHVSIAIDQATVTIDDDESKESI